MDCRPALAWPGLSVPLFLYGKGKASHSPLLRYQSATGWVCLEINGLLLATSLAVTASVLQLESMSNCCPSLASVNQSMSHCSSLCPL